MNLRPLIFLALLLSTLLTVGCSPSYLRSDNYRTGEVAFQIDAASRIADSAENRAVLDVLARYREALVQKDVGTIKSLISKDYYENSGTTDTTEDDYGAKDLPKVYELLARHTDQIRYEIVVKEVRIDGALAKINYEYHYAYRFVVDNKPGWDAGQEINQVLLRNEAEGWKILSGL